MTAGGLDGVRVLVTAGPTREHLDPVRFLSNPSSGRMGYAVAEEAAERGARVALVSGPTALPDPSSVETVRVTSAEDMLEECARRFETCDVLVAVAAVADFRPARRFENKLDKRRVDLTLALEPTPDILATLAARKGPRLVVGFAAQTVDHLARAADKLEAKNLDLIVLNDVGTPGIGFASRDNQVTILAPDGTRVDLGPAPKREIARGIWDAIEARLHEPGRGAR